MRLQRREIDVGSPRRAQVAVAAASPALQRSTTVAAMARIPINIAELVGDTPIVELPELLAGGAPRRQTRACSPSSRRSTPAVSVKDRIGVAMIEAAEAEGRIEPGRTTIVEATSGNTGIALAFVCAAKGYELVLTLPQGMSREREALLRLYGARVEITESMGGMDEAVEAARAMAAARRRLPPRPVLEPREPAGAPPDDRPRDRTRARRRASTFSSPGSGRAARSPVSANTCASSATRSCASSRSSPRARPCSRAGSRDRTASRESARASSRRC